MSGQVPPHRDDRFERKFQKENEGNVEKIVYLCKTAFFCKRHKTHCDMKRIRIICIAAAAVLMLMPGRVSAQKVVINYDEDKIAPYELPDPLVFNNGKKVKNARQWTNKRRAEILEIFAQEMYGHIPAKPEGLHFKTISEDKNVFNGLGTRKVVRIYLDAAEQHWFDALIHIPNAAKGPVPMMVGINFKSNDATLDDRASARWPYELALKNGFGVATAWRDAIEPDGKESAIKDSPFACQDGGVRAWYNKGGDWGAISAWAWGLSRIFDYLETDPAVDCSKVAVLGHSRLGKTSLWAGANDTRFSIVISNCSGCCGAAISRRVFGENFARIDDHFPHWFTREFDKYKWHEDQFPADQHWLAALAAPRPLYIVSHSEDAWADPKGEWLCAYNVAPVYKLFKKKGVDETMPPVDTPDNDATVAYHLQTGPHNINSYDWQQYINFAKRNFGLK